MKLSEAFRKSIKSYYEDDVELEIDMSPEGRKYTKEYFDRMEEVFSLTDVDPTDKKKDR